MQRFKVKEYIDVLRENNQLVDVVSCENILEKEVINVSYSSNNIKKDTLFVCKGFGNNFKREYLEEAITKGAFAYVSQIDYNVEIPCILIKDCFISLSLISDLYFNYASNKLNILSGVGNIYYTSNPNATENLLNTENGWNTNILEVSNPILYMISINVPGKLLEINIKLLPNIWLTINAIRQIPPTKLE